MPILLALPLIISIAASISLALRSGIFVSAISLTCWLEIDPTFSEFGFPLPFSTFAAFLINIDAGAVLTTKSKLLSL